MFSLDVSSLHSCTANLAYGAQPTGLILLSDLQHEGVSDQGMVDGSENDPKFDQDVNKMCRGTIPSCARQLQFQTGCTDPAMALLCGSAHPARLLNMPNKGSLRPGAR